MMHKTHAAASVCLVSLALTTAEPTPLVLAALASQLPDVDTSKSFIGRILFPVSFLLERRFPHRTITHSFLATALVALASFPLRSYSTELYWAVVLGYFIGWFADVFTKTGVTAFYPATSARLVIPANPHLRFSTGSAGEYFLLALFIGATVVSININSAGGLIRNFNTLLAQPAGAIDLFNKEGRTRQVITHIQGRRGASDVSDDYEVVEVMGNASAGEMLVVDRSGELFNVGASDTCAACNIKASRVTAQLGRAIKTEMREVALGDKGLGDSMKPQKFPSSARVYVSGELTLKHATAFVWQPKLQSFNSVVVTDALDPLQKTKTVKLHAASIDDLKKIIPFADDATGNLLLRVVSYE